MEPHATMEPRAGATRQPRGRPRASASWDGTQWTLDPDAAERAATKLVAHRIQCRDRKRATRALLKQVKPKLFEKTRDQPTLAQYEARVHTAEDRMSGSIKATEHKPLHHEVCSQQRLAATGLAKQRMALSARHSSRVRHARRDGDQPAIVAWVAHEAANIEVWCASSLCTWAIVRKSMLSM